MEFGEYVEKQVAFVAGVLAKVAKPEGEIAKQLDVLQRCAPEGPIPPFNPLTESC